MSSNKIIVIGDGHSGCEDVIDKLRAEGHVIEILLIGDVNDSIPSKPIKKLAEEIKLLEIPRGITITKTGQEKRRERRKSKRK